MYMHEYICFIYTYELIDQLIDFIPARPIENTNIDGLRVAGFN